VDEAYDFPMRFVALGWAAGFTIAVVWHYFIFGLGVRMLDWWTGDDP